MAVSLLIGALLLWIGYRLYRRSPGVQRGRWRVGSGLASAVILAAAGFVALRGLYGPAGALGLAGLVLAGMTRSSRSPRSAQAPAATGSLSRDEACAILGVSADADAEEVQAAYVRLMRMAHPDKGGTSGLAAQLNAARDLLSK